MRGEPRAYLRDLLDTYTLSRRQAPNSKKPSCPTCHSGNHCHLALQRLLEGGELMGQDVRWRAALHFTTIQISTKLCAPLKGRRAGCALIGACCYIDRPEIKIHSSCLHRISCHAARPRLCTRVHVLSVDGSSSFHDAARRSSAEHWPALLAPTAATEQGSATGPVNERCSFTVGE